MSKTRASCFIRGSKYLETIKAGSRCLEPLMKHSHSFLTYYIAVSDHYTLPAHSMDNIELVPLEFMTSNRHAIRKAGEAILISKGKTLDEF